MQIIFNGQELLLDPNEKIAITMQINDLAELNKSNTSYTNTFKIQKTALNVKAMEYLGINGANTRIAFRQNNVTVIENGITLIYNGFAKITDAGKEYAINIYGSEKTFFEKVKDVTLQDIYPSTPIVWTADNLLNYVNSTSNWCMPVAQYNGESYHSGSLQSSSSVFSRTKAMSSSPVFFVKALFERIFTHLGYTVSYPMQNDAVYVRLVIPSKKGVSHFPLIYGDTFDIKNCIHDIGADVLIKEMMYRWGLMVKVDEFTKKVTFIKMDTLIKSGAPINWTDKYIETTNITFDLPNYGQRNYFKYADDVIDGAFLQYPANELQGSFLLDNKTLDNEKSVIESQAIKPKMHKVVETNSNAIGRIWFWNTGQSYNLIDIAENTIDDSGRVSNKELPFQICYLKNIGVLNFSIIQPDGVQRTALQIQGRTLAKDYLNWQYYIDNYYSEIVNLFNTPYKVKAVMNLSVIDIYKLDFFSRYYLEQYGAFFYLNKVTN